MSFKLAQLPLIITALLAGWISCSFVLTRTRSMQRKIIRMWRQNHGNLLAGMAAIAGALMSIVWYLDVLPDIRLLPTTPVIGRDARTVKLSPKLLVIAVQSPPNLKAEGTGYLELHSPQGALSDSTSILLRREFEFETHGQTIFLVDKVAPGSYAAVIYKDSNDDGGLNCSPDGVPLEPYALSWSSADDEASLNLTDAQFNLGSDAAMLIRFDLRKPGQATMPEKQSLPGSSNGEPPTSDS